ncbi:hypothetical protein LCGC14_2091210 [marine sediment metagenome]|uniref:Uncharacterized protein n=1 Tax=marine sediment metagenome TaxID=412755 RepID=A0A0F9ECZ0_9ZZZZ
MIIPEDNFAYGFVFNLYSGSKFKFLVNIENSFSLSYVFILLISFGIPLLYYIFYLFLSNFKKLITKINDFGIKMCKIFHRIIIKVISKKFFSVLLLIIIYSSLFIVDWVFFPFLKEEGILILFELVLGTLIFIINIFLFIFGIKYYSFKDKKLIYYLLAILSCSVIFNILFLIRNYYLGIYVLVYRFSSIFILFNLIIIEHSFFKNFMKKNKIFNMGLVVLLLFIGVFYSLRTLSFG